MTGSVFPGSCLYKTTPKKYCDTQDQIDEYWEQLSSHGEEQMCGWLKDQYGISWQIIPADFDHYMLDKNETRRKRVMDALLAMRKVDIQILQNAYRQG